MALTESRLTPHRNAEDVSDPVGAGQKIFQGAIVMLSATGFAIKGATATDLKPRGVAQVPVDNSAGADGDKTIAARKGCFRFKNDASVVRADIGGSAYVVDDETVAKTDGTGTRSALGKIIDVDASGVWVEIA